jgi:quercetin dioxygenase-like cupin family protein
MPVIHEDDVERLKKTGRDVRWLINSKNTGSKYLSVLLIEVPVGSTVKPAHSHPDGEEVIYIIEGKGRVWIDGQVSDVGIGNAVLFPQGSVHMLQNCGTEEMKVICFYAPPADFTSYQFHEDVEFPD